MKYNTFDQIFLALVCDLSASISVGNNKFVKFNYNVEQDACLQSFTEIQIINRKRRQVKKGVNTKTNKSIDLSYCYEN